MDYATAWQFDLEQAYMHGDKEAGAEIRRRREAAKAEMKAKNAALRGTAGTVSGISPQGYADWGGDGNEDGS